MINPNYIEFKATDMKSCKSFYGKAFGFEFTDYGPEYACVQSGAIALGFAQGKEPEAPMPTFETKDLDASLAAVRAAGGEIVKDIFSFPGGKRFECLDPSGNRIAVFEND